ncbi:hypothetical protein DPV78_006660 [Talaromyces pinophilus]|nr:hypothetical protein DPV78_006660 [Talaromyces pinophilus]
MAPVKRSYDEETQSSDWTNERPDSPPIKRPRSEPTQTLPNFNNSSVEVSLSPPVSEHHQITCPWCSESFDAPEDGVVSAHDALKEHIALVHPRIANLSAHEDPIKDDDSDITMADHNDLVNGHLKGALDGLAAVTAPATDADVTPAGSQTPEISLTAGAAESLDSKLHDLERQQVHAANAEKRLMSCWNLHDTRKFSTDYDDTTADLEDTWCYVFDDSKPTNNKANGKKAARPNPYLSDTTEKGGFLKLTPVEKFLDTLTDFESMPTDQLHAAAQNVFHALKTWQDEWMAIEELNKRVTTKPKKFSNPRALDPPEVFRDKKEAMLYGYKYDASIHEPKKREANNSETTFKCPDPFVQGGFKPTAAQLRKMQTEVGKNNTNPDNFKTMTRNGKEYVPKFQDQPLIPYDSRGSASRKRKLPQGEIAALRQPSVHDSTTAVESDLDGQPFKRVTRSVNKTEKPQTQTAPPSPGTRPRGGKKRKGITTQAAQPTNTTTITSQPSNLATNVTFKTVTSNTVGTLTDHTLSTANETAPSSRAITSPPVDGLTSVSGSEQAAITPATMPALAPAAPGAPPALAALPQTLAEPDEELSEAELRRRDKIANSKNPRRTIAMLDHWAKYHKDGKKRKPKRTKEQMEADRLAEEARRANGQGKVRRRRRKAATTTVDGSATGQQRTATTTLATPTATATVATTATGTGTASGSTTMSMQPLSIQPAATSTTIAPIAPPPPPPARTMTQAYPIPLNEPPRPQSSRGFPSLHPLIPIAPPEPQPAMASYTSQPVLPSVDRNTVPPPPRWASPSQYYTYGNPPPPSPYHPYGQPQYPPPPPPSNHLHQPPRRDTGLPETVQPSANYLFDVRRPRPPLPPLQNPPRP